MITEWLDRCTPASRAIRAMGFLRETNGIRKRYHRCQTYWQPHLQQCHQLIREGAERCSLRRKALVLGAGLLHDVPLRFLANTFEKVYLVDIVHPLSSRWQTRRMANVERITADITNTLEDLYAVSDEPQMELPRSTPDLFVEDPTIDLTVSLNLLSQLACMPLAYVRRWRAHSTEAMDAYAQTLSQRIWTTCGGCLAGRYLLAMSNA